MVLASGKPPLIVVGMHRSGTQLVTEMLGELGVFMGARCDAHGEALLPQELNRWTLSKHGCRWDHPSGIRYLMSDDAARRAVAHHYAMVLGGARVAEYLGFPGRTWLDIGRGRRLWGFKDPRTTFTLPAWLELFPEARVVSVLRHGVDVAQSLSVRERRSFEQYETHRARMRARPERLVYSVYRKRSGVTASPRCLSLGGAFSLWEEYALEAEAHVASLGPRATTVRFEDLARDPHAAVEGLVAFLGLELPASRLAAAAARVRTDRASAYRADAALRTFAESQGESLARFGYSP